MEESLNSLSTDYLNLLVDGQLAFSDVTFSVDGRLIHAHRCVLAARSLFFHRFFCSLQRAALPTQYPTTNASVVGVVPVNSVSYDVFLLVLQFLYSGRISFAPLNREQSAVDLVLDALNAARSFDVEQLVMLAQNHFNSKRVRIGPDPSFEEFANWSLETGLRSSTKA